MIGRERDRQKPEKGRGRGTELLLDLILSFVYFTISSRV